MKGLLKSKRSVDRSLDKRSIVSLAKKSAALDFDENDPAALLPWHAVADVAVVVDDLASNQSEGLSAGEKWARKPRGRNVGRAHTASKS